MVPSFVKQESESHNLEVTGSRSISADIRMLSAAETDSHRGDPWALVYLVKSVQYKID